jgi:uncharacterized membrane protein YkvA (DUF1232 family)
MNDKNTQSLDESQQKKALILRDELAKSFDEEQAEDFSKKNEGRSWYQDFMLLYQMFKDKEYTLDTKTKLTIAGALAYVIFPVDIIPDFLPIVGWLDDAFVLGFTINSLSEEIQRYKAFKGMEA